jgi:hypothetical protein
MLLYGVPGVTIQNVTPGIVTPCIVYHDLDILKHFCAWIEIFIWLQTCFENAFFKTSISGEYQ